jgi:Na+-translocating ferredoxin:NAD+ oxidoreductase subunit C
MLFNKSFGIKGIVQDDNKFATINSKIESGYIPNTAYIPVLNNYGNPSRILVKPGDIVEEGQLIAQGDGELSSNVHASIPGKVVSYGKKYLFNGRISDVIVIELEGEFKKTGRKYDIAPWTTLTKDYILRKIKEYGITGTAIGEHSFIKTSMFTKKLNTLVINAMEIEPYLTFEHRLMVEKLADIIDGINIVKNTCEIQNVFICISSDKKEAINKFKTLISANKYDFKLIPMKYKYPHDNERLLIKSVSGKFFPSDIVPIDKGYMVISISSLIAIKEAIVDDKPLIDNIITVSGGGINNPGNLKIKIGSLVSEIINECGGLKPGVKKIIINGPMSGFAQINLDTPVTKNMNAILALTDDESKNFENNSICINCGKCIKSCAFGLMPNVLNRYLKNNLYEKAFKSGLNYCTECGACSWICPSRIPLLQIFKNGKETFKNLKENKNR